MCVARYTSRGNSHTRRRTTTKTKGDAELVAQIPKPDVVRAAGLMSMAAPHWIVAGALAGEIPLAKAMAAATMCVVGVVYWNGFAGRPGEWTRLKVSYVQAQLESGAGHVVCAEHKAVDQYGDLGKYISPGAATALLKYLELSRQQTDMLLEAPGAEPPRIARNQQDCCNAFPGGIAVTPAIARKATTTQLASKARMGKAVGLLKRVDAHSERVAAEVRTVHTPAGDAKQGKWLFEETMGEAQTWPTDLQLQEMRSVAGPLVHAGLHFGWPGASQAVRDGSSQVCKETAGLHGANFCSQRL